jgi:hypothetical protein
VPLEHGAAASLEMPLIELPEVGASPLVDSLATEPMPAPALLLSEPIAGAGALADVPIARDEITLEDIETEAVAFDAQDAAGPAFEETAVAEAGDDGAVTDEITVGDVTLSAALFGILV